MISFFLNIFSEIVDIFVFCVYNSYWEVIVLQGTMKRSATVQAVLPLLRHDIITGKLENDLPVTEIVFSETYGCSRAALRGAINILEQEGLIKVMPNGTKKICSLSNNDINNLYELRSFVECTAAKQILSKKNMDISRLIAVLETSDKSTTIDFIDADAMFHETLVELSGNKALMQVWKTFMPVMRELFLINFSVAEKMEESLTDRHMHLAKLLFDRDDTVINVLKAHIEEARALSTGKNNFDI